MPIRVYKIADIIDGVVVFSGIRRFRQGDLAAILTNLKPLDDPNQNTAWQLEIIIGEGPGERLVRPSLD